jgi:hypothetical protein
MPMWAVAIFKLLFWGWDEMPAWQTRVILIADGSIFMRAPVFQILAILIIWASLSPDSTALIRISKMQK